MDWELVRLVNATLSVLVLIGMALSVRWWLRQTYPVRLLLTALMVAVGTAGYSAVEILLVAPDAPAGGRTLMTTVFIAYAGLALLFVPRKKRRQ